MISDANLLGVLGGLVLSIFLQGSAIAGDQSLPIFPKENVAEGEPPFRRVLKAYNKQNYALALKETRRLRKEHPQGPISEAAAFLLGDLHLKLAGKGGSKHLRKALSAFRTARTLYPDSENAVRGLWRIGQVYAMLNLYYESIANFNRILIRHPKNPFAARAQVGIAETYRRWGKFKKALENYNKIDLPRLSPEEQNSVLIGQADLFYQLGTFEEAYRIYEKIPKEADTLRMMPEDLFQYGESAYRAKRYKRSRKIFMTFFNLYPKAPLAPIALARVGETWNLEGNITLSRSILKQIRSLHSESSDGKINDLLTAINDLRFIPDRKGNQTGEGRLALKEIKEQTEALLADPSLPLPFQRVILEAAEQSAWHGALVNALEIEGALLARLSSSPFQEEVRAAFQNTVDKTIAQLSKENDVMRVVELYHRHPAGFKPKRSNDSLLLKAAIAHAQTGLFTEAVKLLTPIAANKKNLLGEEALFHLTDTHYQNSEYKNAEENARQFLARYSRSIRLPHVLEIFAQAKDRQGKLDQAIQEYRSWLNRYPRHRDHHQISLLLADAYQRKGDLKLAVKILAKIDSDFGKSNKGKDRHAGLHLKLADAYFQLGKYRKAAAFYRLVLKDKPGGEKADWAQFQLAMSYDRLGKKNQGAQIFAQLAENAEDPLLKEFSSQKTREDR